MRGLLNLLTAIFLLAGLVGSADAQIRLGGHVANLGTFDEMSRLEGTTGVGARVGVEFPFLLIPMGLYGSATHYFSETSYWTGSVFGKVGLPVPGVSPFGMLGVRHRNLERLVEGPSAASSSAGFFAGLGLEIGSLFLETSVDFDMAAPSLPDFETELLTFKAGFIVGE